MDACLENVVCRSGSNLFTYPQNPHGLLSKSHSCSLYLPLCSFNLPLLCAFPKHLYMLQKYTDLGTGSTQMPGKALALQILIFTGPKVEAHPGYAFFMNLLSSFCSMKINLIILLNGKLIRFFIVSVFTGLFSLRLKYQ